MAYSLTDIINYEDKTRQYCLSEGGVELSTEELIELAAKEKEFNSDYAEYLIFKYLHLLSKYITEKAKNKGYQIDVKDNKMLKDDIKNNNISESIYEEWIEFYYHPDVYEIANKALMDKNWNVLYYLYYKEENELINFLMKKINKLNERKFFIIQ